MAASCKARLRRVEYNLQRAIEQADGRGYTGMVRSKGGAFDDPRVKSLMKKRDVLLRSCTHIAVKRKGKWVYG